MNTRLCQIALAVYCFALNFDAWSAFGEGAFSVPKLIALFYLAIIVVSKRISLSVYPFNFPFLSLMLTICAIVFSTLFHSTDNEFDVKRVQPLVFNLVIFWVMLKQASSDPKCMRIGLLCFCLGSVAMAVLSWLGVGVSTNAEGRITMFGDNENVVGVRSSICAIVLFLYLLENRFKKWFVIFPLIGGIAFTMKLVLSTGSRVAFLSSALAITAMCIAHRSKYVLWKAAIVCSFVAAIPLVISYLETTSVFSRLERMMYKGDTAGRVDVWRYSLEAFYESPLIGLGYSGMGSHIGKYESPHNVIIELLALSGVVGLMFYLIFLAHLSTAGVSAFRKQRDVLPMLVLIPMAGMLLTGQVLDSKIFYLIPAFVLSSPYACLANLEEKRTLNIHPLATC